MVVLKIFSMPMLYYYSQQHIKRTVYIFMFVAFVYGNVGCVLMIRYNVVHKKVKYYDINAETLYYVCLCPTHAHQPVYPCTLFWILFSCCRGYKDLTGQKSQCNDSYPLCVQLFLLTSCYYNKFYDINIHTHTKGHYETHNMSLHAS